MPKVHRHVKGKGFTGGITHKFKENTDKDIQPTDPSKIKGLFGRKEVMVEWENTDTGETIYIPVKQLLPGQIRMISEQVFTEPGFKIINDGIPEEPTDEQKLEIYRSMGVSTEAEFFEKIREQAVKLVKAAIQIDIDEKWLLEEASKEFLDTLRSAALGSPATEDNSVDTFPGVDPEPEE